MRTFLLQIEALTLNPVNISSFLTARRARVGLGVCHGCVRRRLMIINKSICSWQLSGGGYHHWHPPRDRFLPERLTRQQEEARAPGCEMMDTPQQPWLRSADRSLLLWWCPPPCLDIGTRCMVFHVSIPVQRSAMGPNSAGYPGLDSLLLLSIKWL